MVLGIVQRLNDEGPSRGVLCEILDALSEVLECERVFLFSLRDAGGFHVRLARNHDRESLSRPSQMLSHFAVRKMVAEQKLVFVEDARKDRRYRPEETLEGRKLPVSIIVLPLRIGGKVEGGIYADHRLRPLDKDKALTAVAEIHVALLELCLQLRRKRDAVAQARRAFQARAGAAAPPPRGETPSGDDVPRGLLQSLLDDERPPQDFHGLLTVNPDLLDTCDTIRNLDSTTLPVLVRGETGSGKELLARAIHASSPRRDKPFVALAASALPEELVASELLGYVKGAFTGAEGDRDGIFVQAHEGTLFLDEVEEMSAGVQKKLLRVLADGEVRALGSKAARMVDVRLICATKADLEDLVEREAFRADLYFRLKGLVFDLPPLRDRREDVLPLVRHFFEAYANPESEAPPRLTRAAKLSLLRHSWSGNVRELENEVRRLLALGLEAVDAADLELAEGPSTRVRAARTLAEVVHLAEREAVLEALRASSGNKSEAAKRLGITRKALYRRLAKYGLPTTGAT